MNYAQIILCQKTGGALKSFLTYIIPTELALECKVGSFVQVPLRQGWARGLVVRIDKEVSQNAFQLKPIQSIFKGIFLPPFHIQLALEMADYYCSSLAKVLNMMLPAPVWKGIFTPPKTLFYQLLQFDETLKGKKQQAVLDLLKKKGGCLGKEILIKELGGVSAATLKTLLEKSLIALKEEPLYCAPSLGQWAQKEPVHQLTKDQNQALETILKSKKPVLLHGVTGSGKTEIYLHLILKAIQSGGQALLLVPEIALTPQMIDYFKAYLGPHLAVFHSGLSAGERATNWHRVQVGHARLVIGSRSAVFSPVERWACVIVDEEHEWTYKQESSPYYQTHFVVERWQKWMGAKVVLASATPRLESFHKSQTGDYGYVHLPDRIGMNPLPQLQIVDLREEFKQRHFSIFSRRLLREMQEALEKGEQVILFVNQRGSARAVVCRDCGYTSICKNCEVRLTLHQDQGGKLICHYCGQSYPVPVQCPDCDSVHIKHIGVGTQRVEEECRRYFPQFNVLRADQDSTRFKDGFLNLYETFKAKKAHILVGTQMIAKGLHFEGVALIGIILADIGLNIPDFRAHERVFQLITQVSGRSGRGQTAGRVILQTYQPEHFVFKQAQAMDYTDFANHELALRKKHEYPPFGCLIKFIVVGHHSTSLIQALLLEKGRMEEVVSRYGLGLRVSVAPALVPKISGQFYFHVLVQGQNPHLLFKHWQIPVGWRVDVDPVKMG